MAPVFDPSKLVEAIDGPRISVPFTLIYKLGGDFQAAAFLSQAAYFSSLAREKEGWFDLKVVGVSDPAASNIFDRAGSWEALLGLGKDAQREIRKKLKGLGLLEERREGIPARIKYRVDSQAYLTFLAQENRQLADFRQLDGGNPPTSQRKAADKSAAFPPSIPKSSPKSSPKTKTTTTTSARRGGGSGNEEKPTPTPDQQKGEDVKQSQGNGLEDLEIEPCLLNHLPTLSLPSFMPLETRQQILDELAGALLRGNIKKSPAAFLKGLITRQAKGEFQPDLGHQVSASRAKRVAHEIALAKSRAAAPGERPLAMEQPRPRQRIDVMNLVASAKISLVKSKGNANG